MVLLIGLSMYNDSKAGNVKRGTINQRRDNTSREVIVLSDKTMTALEEIIIRAVNAACEKIIADIKFPPRYYETQNGTDQLKQVFPIDKAPYIPISDYEIGSTSQYAEDNQEVSIHTEENDEFDENLENKINKIKEMKRKVT